MGTSDTRAMSMRRTTTALAVALMLLSVLPAQLAAAAPTKPFDS